jgi:cation diffusion facilitator family transporter
MDSARKARTVAALGIAASGMLAAAKIAVGLAGNSVAAVSDGIESSTDVLTSGLVYLGLRVAARPADENHPYGHGRFETLMGLAVGITLVLVAAGICWRSLENRAEAHAPALFVLWPLGVSAAVKVVLAAAKLRIGRQVRSTALVADAWNDSVDLLSVATAIVAVLLSARIPGLAGADHWGGFVIGLIVFMLAVRTIRETTMHLMDTMPEPEQMDEIRTAALQVPGALGVDKCFARRTGLRYHVDLHLEVDPELTVMASHEIAHAVKNHLIEQLPWVQDVLVHVEPYTPSRFAGLPGGVHSGRM